MGLALMPSKVSAQYYSQSNVNKSISVDKKVRNVNDSQYVDNISADKEVFADDDLVEFKITVLNNGNETLTNVNVGDSLPTNLSLIFYPGTLDKTNNSLKWSIDSLKPQESKDFLIRAKMVNISTLLSGESTKKLTNFVEAKANDVSDKDTASIFVGLKTSPKTGDNSLALKTVGVLSILVSCVYLRKYARGY